MTKKVDTWMPFLIDKYLGDTTHLTTEQHGAYVLLLLSMWKRDGALPNADEQLMAITRLQPSRWRANRAVVLAFFTPTEDGKSLTQKRLAAELVNANKRSAAKSEAGAKGAAAKWQKDGTAIGKQDGTAIADGCQPGCQTGASISIPTPSELFPTSDDVGADQPKADPPQATPDCPHKAIIAAYHEALPVGRGVLDWTPARASALRARWNEDAKRQNLDWWKRFFAFVAKSKFLTGQVSSNGRRPFELSLDWLVKAENFAKVREGAYHVQEEATA